jgi:hypothetical protein
MTLLRTTQLIAALQWRRLQNRMRFGFRKKNVEERSGTARKSGGGFLLMSFLAVVFAFQSLIFTSDFLKEVSFVIGPLRDDQGCIQVSASSYKKIEALDRRRMDGAEENTTAGFEVLEGQGLSWPTLENRNLYRTQDGLTCCLGAGLCFEDQAQPINLTFWGDLMRPEHRAIAEGLPRTSDLGPGYVDWRIWRENHLNTIDPR